MSKDEEIQQLREKLARTEGERDALRQVIRDKVSTAPTSPPVFPYIPYIPSLPMPNRCWSCGTYYYGSYHACYVYVPMQPYVPAWNPWPITCTTQTATWNTNGQSIASANPPVLTNVFIDGKAIT